VSSWIVSGAGDALANGLYMQVDGETWNDHPVYRQGGNPTGYALYYWDAPRGWVIAWYLGMDPTMGEPCYCNQGDPLPGAWATYDGMTPPAPTVVENTGPTPPDWPWPWWWYPYDPPLHGPNDTIRPCRATINSLHCVAFPWITPGSSSVVTLFDTAGHEWFRRETYFEQFFSDPLDHDPGQTLCSYDVGDGTQLYLCLGSCLTETQQPQFTFSKWSVTGDYVTRTALETVALPSVHITPLLQTPGSPATFRFLAVAADGTTVGLWEYVAFSGDLALIGEAPVPALPTGFSQVTCSADEIGRWDHVLIQREATLYWMRHCQDGSTPPQHRIVAATLA